MLDTSIKEQLKTVFKVLEQEVTLVLSNSSHENQSELLQMAQDLSATSHKIKIKNSSSISSVPKISLEYGGRETGITFLGVPGGHEFSSLVLGILNVDGKGKFPDEILLKRIKKIKGKHEVRTFISLSCENCPDVVQALNQVAIINQNISHTTIDGALFSEEVSRLNILGVPSVMVGDKLLSSGKISLTDLITKLEGQCGINESLDSDAKDSDLGDYDVVVLGAGPAGASAAIYSARKGLKTAILAERIGGQVKDTKGIENLTGIKYTQGAQLTSQMLDHINQYEIKILEHRRVKNVSTEVCKKIELESGEYLKSKSLIIATGAKWRELGVPGEKEYLGKGVAFCPHCDGPYFKGKNIAVIGGGNSGVEAALDLAGIVKSVTVIEFNPDLKADKVLIEKLYTKENVKVIKNAMVKQVSGDGQKVSSLSYEERETGELIKINIEGVFVQIGLIPNSSFIQGTVDVNKRGEIIIDEKCRTNIPGIYAAGDVTTVPYKQIIVAMGEGAKAGLSSFEDLMLGSTAT
jgi:NADH-dependent peroxiredoxin subunit F